jgi:hypothetical protein
LNLFFQPPSGTATGTKSGTLTIADNSLNASGGATQTVALQGIVIGTTPILVATKSHGGNNFALGQKNATYVVTVSTSPASAALIISNSQVTVTENLPTGLTLVSMAGNFWNCSSNVCQYQSIGISPGTTLPPITVTVNVATNAPSSVTNSVTVSGGGASTITATDPTTIMQVQTSVLNGATATGGAGVVVHVPLTLALTSGITMDTLNFGVVITPSSGAPALVAATSFVADSSLSVTTNIAAGSSASQTGVFVQSTAAAFTGSFHLGDVLVTVPGNATVGQSYTVTIQGTGGALAGVTIPLNSTNGSLAVEQYLVGDVYPYTADSAGSFGDGAINTLDLISVLRAVVNLTGFVPQTCSDRYDAMDAYPVDTVSTRGGDGLLNTLDLIETLRRAVNIDTSRPYRAARGIACYTASNSAAPARKSPSMTEGDLEMAPAGAAGDGWSRTAVYLRARVNLNLTGLSLSLGADQGSSAGLLRFVPAANQSPSLVDNAIAGKLGVAWLNATSVPAGQRLLLGYVEAPRGTRALTFYGVSANMAGDGHDVNLTFGSARPAVSR